MKKILILLIVTTYGLLLSAQTLKEKAEGGDMDAQYQYAESFINKSNPKEDDYAKAIPWLQKSAEQGHTDAMFYLGECYAHGYGVVKDMPKAIEWYEKGVDKESTDAEYALAILFLEGNGVEKDSITATNLLLHSAGGGYCEPHQLFYYDNNKANNKAREKLLELSGLIYSPTHHYFLAMTGCLYEAIKDYNTAEQYYKSAVEKGSYLGTIELGLMYFYILANTPQYYSCYDIIDESDEDVLGLESYKFADNSACLEYVKTKKWSDQDNVAYWLEKAINYGFGSFKYGIMPYDLYDHLLFVYVDGVGLMRDMEMAIDIVYKCLTDSTYKDGVFDYYHEEVTLEIAEKKPFLYNKLFKTYNNLNKYIQDNSTAKDIAKKVAYGGLGKCYYKGNGIDIDYDKAFNFLSKAVKYDNCESMRLLAACYRFGRGTNKSSIKDEEWTSKAAKCGDDRAKKIAEMRGY